MLHFINKKEENKLSDKNSKEIYRELVSKLNMLEKKNRIIEQEIFSAYRALEYKVWENNINTNKMLYELQLLNKKKKKDFNPLVSIIIPVYNGSNYLCEAINAALSQTYKNIEIIVVNDGSTDNGATEDIATKFGSKIKYYYKENGGVSSALNYGISKMRGEYFSWLSHDDLIEESHIEYLVNHLSFLENEKTIPYASFKIVDEEGIIKIHDTILAQLHMFDYKTSMLKNEYALLQGEINGGSVLIPKIAFEKHGLFDEQQKITQERDMWARLISEYKFINIPYDTAIIRNHSKQVTNNCNTIKVESDAKNLEIIKNMSDEVINKLEFNKNSFYKIMANFYKNNNNLYMEEKMLKLIDKKTKKDYIEERKFSDIIRLQQKKLRILQVNNIDLLGRRFNGYDLLDEINNNSIHSANQVVIHKLSKNKNVYKLYNSKELLSKHYILENAERELLSAHSQLSLTSNALKESDVFKEADIVHYHLIHNTKLSLSQMIELCSDKPSILTIHDPWNFTGRCVHPEECKKWKNGCKDCEALSSLFEFTQDNCHSLWNLKKKIYKKLDVDIIVSTSFMKNMLEESPLTRHFKNVHVLPFGIDLNKFNVLESKENSRKKLGINKDDIVIFFRAQMAMKGTEFVIEALKKLKCNKKITLLTCSEKGLLNELSDRYNIIDLGDIGDEMMVTAYHACDIFLMPSRGESFGMMAIEAMASSRPVVIFNNSALPSVTFAPECGVLVENKNSQKLMEAIKMLIDNPEERIRRGNLGRKLAEEHYDIEKYNKKIIEIYEKAYERQKDKKIITKEKENINPESIDVKFLILKLEQIYKKLFGNKNMPKELLKYKDKSFSSPDGYKIDYSSWDVINLIELFNEKIYEETKKYSEFIKNNKLKKLYYYCIYDRPALYEKLKCIIRRIPVIYPILRKFKSISNKDKKEM